MDLSKKVAIPVVVVALLVGGYVALPCACSDTGKKAPVAQMKSDLRNLVTAQESFFDSARSYSADLRALHFTPAPGVTIAIARGDSGWSASASHERQPRRRCAVFVGAVAPPPPATTEGGVRCEASALN